LTERDSGTETEHTLTGPLLRQIGHHLRLAREERGETLQDIAQLLRIRRVYLEALEKGDLSDVPGRAYALGFLRSYGDHLGFNGEAIVAEVKRTDEPLPENPTLQVREPLPESHRPPLVLVGASLILAAVVYVGWSYWQERDGPPREVAALDRPASAGAEIAADGDDATPTAGGIADGATTAPAEHGATTALPGEDDELPPLPAVPEPPMPESVDALGALTEITAAATTADGDAMVTAILEGAETALEPVRAAATAEGAQALAGADTTAEAAAPAPAEDVAPASEATEFDLLAVVAAQSGGAALRTFGDEEATSRVVLVASEPSWVQVKSASSDYVWTRTLEPGDAYFVPERADLALWTGNAGGLKVVVDGAPLAPLGETGQVRRDIPLAADALSAQYAPD
jgi:cytoskeleton protein RodZ